MEISPCAPSHWAAAMLAGTFPESAREIRSSIRFALKSKFTSNDWPT
jgi:hypothetical protein